MYCSGNVWKFLYVHVYDVLRLVCVLLQAVQQKSDKPVGDNAKMSEITYLVLYDFQSKWISYIEYKPKI